MRKPETGNGDPEDGMRWAGSALNSQANFGTSMFSTETQSTLRKGVGAAGDSND
jgi:hypothetical protein